MVRTFVLVLALAGPVWAQSSKRETSFVEHSSSECQFSVYFPGKKPTIATKKLMTNAGEVSQTTATLEGRDATYTVTVTELPGEAAMAGLKTLADGVRDSLKGTTGKVDSDKEITHGEGQLPGRELLLDFGRNWARTRVFVAKSKLYQVSVTGSKAAVTTTTVDKFLASFALKD